MDQDLAPLLPVLADPLPAGQVGPARFQAGQIFWLGITRVFQEPHANRGDSGDGKRGEH